MRRNVKLELVLISISILIISLAILLGNALARSEQRITDAVRLAVRSSTSLAAERIKDKSDQHYALLKTLAEIQEIKDPTMSVGEKCKILSYFASLHSDYINIFYTNEKGFTVNHLGQEMDVSAIPEFQKCLKTGEGCVGNSEANQVDGSLSIAYCEPVRSITDNSIIGVICSVVNFSSFMEIIKENVLGNESNPFVVSMDGGRIIAVNDASVVGLNLYDCLQPNDDEKALFDVALKGETGEGTFLTSDGTKMIATYRPLGEGYNWVVLGVVPYNDYFVLFAKLKKNLMFLTAFIAIGAALLLMAIIVVYFKPLLLLKKSIDEIGSGNADLTQRINSDRNDEFGDVVKSFNFFIGKLQDIMKNLKQSKGDISEVSRRLVQVSEETVIAIEQISSNIKGVNDEMNNQTAAVVETSTALNEIDSNIKSLERMVVNQAGEIQNSSSAVEEMVENVRSVKDTMDKMASSFSSLIGDAESGSNKLAGVNDKVHQIENESQMLQEANAAISAIAEQTNLLAMNAAIEAAHAGEAGKGFAVVADEIRKLSETSTDQSKTIGTQLSSIQESIEAVVQASVESDAVFNTLKETIENTDEVVRNIKDAMDEQAAGSSQITRVIANMNNSSAEVQGASSEMGQGSRAILDEVHKLENISMKIQESLASMTNDVEAISDNGQNLNEITSLVEENIRKMGEQIDLFTV